MMSYLTLIVVRYLLKYEETLILLPSSLKNLSYWLETTVKYILCKQEIALFGSELFLFVCKLVAKERRVCPYSILAYQLKRHTLHTFEATRALHEFPPCLLQRNQFRQRGMATYVKVLE